MNIFDICYLIILIIGICALILGLFVSLCAIKKYLYNPWKKEKRICLLNKKINEISNLDDTEKAQTDVDQLNKFVNELKTLVPVYEEPILSIKDIEMTERIKVLIDNMIATEIYAFVKPSIALRNKIDIRSLDVGVKTVETNVMEGLNASVFKTPLLFNESYLIKYICTNSYSALLKFVTEYNDTFNV